MPGTKKQEPKQSFSRAAENSETGRFPAAPDHLGEIAENILEDTLGDDARLDSLLLANFMLPLKNEDIPPANRDANAMRILADLAALRALETFGVSAAYLDKACELPATAKNLFVARAVARIEDPRLFEADKPRILEREFLEDFGEGLSRLIESGGVADKLRGRAADAFNSLAVSVKSCVRLWEDRDSRKYFVTGIAKPQAKPAWTPAKAGAF